MTTSTPPSLKGGPGSGNFDHAGREGEVEGSSSDGYFGPFGYKDVTDDLLPKFKTNLKGGEGSGNFEHEGRKGERGGSASDRGGALHAAISSRVRWEPNESGRITLARGGPTPKSGPMFLSTNPDVAIPYGEGRELGTYSFDASKILRADSSEWDRLFGPDLAEEMAQDLYTDPPPHVLETLKAKGYGGFASASGDYVRIEDAKLAKMRFDRRFTDFGKKSLDLNEVIIFKPVNLKGGVGSGNFGHAGREGEVGGSASGSEGSSSGSDDRIDEDVDQIMTDRIRDGLFSEKDRQPFVDGYRSTVETFGRPFDLPDKFQDTENKKSRWVGVSLNNAWESDEENQWADDLRDWTDSHHLEDGIIYRGVYGEFANKVAQLSPGDALSIDRFSPFSGNRAVSETFDDRAGTGVTTTRGDAMIIYQTSTSTPGVFIGGLASEFIISPRKLEVLRRDGNRIYVTDQRSTKSLDTRQVILQTARTLYQRGSLPLETQMKLVAYLRDDRFSAIVKGGEGSGNFGHEGRKGEVGGSSSGGGKSILDRLPEGSESLFNLERDDPSYEPVAGLEKGVKYRDISTDEILFDRSRRLGIPYKKGVAVSKAISFQPILSSYAGSHIDEAASSEFEIPLSEFEKSKIARVTADSAYARAPHNAEQLRQDYRGGFSYDDRPLSDSQMKRLVRSTYDDTQKLLSDLGITELTLYRGSESGSTDLNVLSHWTMDKKAAEQFQGPSKTISTITIPASRVWAVPATGFGVRSQAEVIVLREIPSSSTKSINLKGGEGSGNFGHEGRKGEVGGSSSGGTSSSIPSNLTLHHFTRSSNLESIRSQGLQPKQGGLAPLLGRAIFLSDDPQYNKSTGFTHGDTQIDVTLNAKKTFHAPSYAEYLTWAVENSNGIDPDQDLVGIFKSHGYDSAIIDSKNGRVYAIFDPSIIKYSSTKSIDLKALSWRPWSRFESLLISAFTSALEKQRISIIDLLLKTQLPDEMLTESAWSNLSQILQDAASSIILDLAAFAVNRLKSSEGGTGIGLDWGLANTNAALWARTHSSSMIKGINDRTRDAVRSQISEWTSAGEDFDQLVKRISSIKLENGEEAFGRQRARLIAITEASTTFSNANSEAWKSIGYSPAIFKPGESHPGCRCYLQPKTVDGVKVLVWFTARDERVCKVPLQTPFGVTLGCNGLHGIIVSEGSLVGQKANV